MAKIAVIGLKKHRQTAVSILHDMSIMQLEPLSQDVDTFLKNEREGDLHRKISDQLLRVKGLLNSIPPSKISGRSRFSSTDELIKRVESIDIDNSISLLELEKESLLTKISETQNNLKLLDEFSFFPEDLNVLHLSSGRSFFGRIDSKKYPEFKKRLESHEDDVILYAKEGVKITRFILVVTSQFPSNALASIVNLYDLTLEAIPNLKGKPFRIFEEQKQIYNDQSSRLEQINNQLKEISKKHYSFLKAAEEQLEIESKYLDVIENLGSTKDAFALEGWVPKSKIASIESALKTYCGGTLVYTLETKENPPTLLANPKKFKVFESFIRFYSLPSGNEFDPTMIFGLIFPIFYGMMLGDVGYGLVILLVSRWVIRRVEGKKRNLTIMPRFLRNFAKMILLPSQMVKLAKAMSVGAIIAIGFGFIYDLYFGFHLNQYIFPYLHNLGLTFLPTEGSFLDPLSTFGLRKLLLVSGFIGLGMVSFGLILGILNSIREGQKKHVLGKIGWLMFGWGIALIGLALIGHQDISPTGSITGAIYFALIFGGIGLMFVGEGVRALMELPSIISHILSFTRIIGILLASVILADVIDFIFLKTIDNPIPQNIIGVMILFIGHIFNIILGVFEPGIQGARLLYVEFFSKFYHGNGRPFNPFGNKRRYTYDQCNIEPYKS